MQNNTTQFERYEALRVTLFVQRNLCASFISQRSGPYENDGSLINCNFLSRWVILHMLQLIAILRLTS